MGKDKQRLLGAVIVCRSGNVAEYLLGITNSHGRLLQCNSLLLWESLLWAHRNGCHRFDLGGINAATPQGIARFKRGLNSIEYAEAGDWRKINFFKRYKRPSVIKMISIHPAINEFLKHLPIGTLLFVLLHLLNIFIGMCLLVVTIQQSASLYTNVKTHLLGIILCVQIALSVFYFRAFS